MLGFALTPPNLLVSDAVGSPPELGDLGGKITVLFKVSSYYLLPTFETFDTSQGVVYKWHSIANKYD